MQVWDILAQPPNLDDLSMSGIFMDSRELSGIGTVLRGRFGGRLLLHGGYIGCYWRSHLGCTFPKCRCVTRASASLPMFMLAEAFGKTLVKLLHTDTFHRGRILARAETSYGRRSVDHTG